MPNKLIMKKVYFLLLFFATITQAQVVNIPDQNFKIKLITLGIDTNHDEEIQESEALAVTSLFVYQSNITSMIGIEAFTNLTYLNCANNQLIDGLNIGNLTHLESLYAGNCNLSSLDLTNLVNLDTFYCNNNNITTIDLSHQVNMMQMACSTNPLTTIDISMMPQLQSLNVGYTLLTYLDLSNNPNLCLVACDNAPMLTRINMKDGSVSCLEDKIFFNNPNLINVCVDQGEALAMQNYFITHNMPNVNVSTYCTFVPGGDYNTITGTLAYDFNDNGCDVDDYHQSMIKVRMTNGSSISDVFTNDSGSYFNYTTAGNFSIAPELENSAWFTLTPTSAIASFLNSNNNTASYDFCITANGFHPDMEVIVLPLTTARPGFDANYQITFKNKGNYIYSEGIVGFQFDDAVLDFVSASENPLTQAAGQINWNFTNLLPFESRSIEITLNVNGPMETPPVNINDLLNFTASSFPSEVDETPLDNTFTYQQTVVGSFDPNDKTCLEGNIINAENIGKYLHYSINFENTGTAAAEKIVVKDIIDITKFDMSTLQILSTSHPATTKITGNKVEFMFDNITLAPTFHGNVVFKIKTKNNLTVGSTVSNKAEIYFDYNFPIETNTATSTFQTLSNVGFETDHSVRVFPNPTKNRINITASELIKTIQLFDGQGRLMNTSLVNDLKSTFDVSSYSKGIYFLKVQTGKGIKTEKIIKE
jgi:hypothetical protein